MHVAMVIIYKKTLEKKGVDDVASKGPDLGLFQAQTMSQGTALFSCGLMETSRWCEMGRGYATQPRPAGASLESLWDVLPEVHHQSPVRWRRDVGAVPGAITSLLQDLSLTGEATAASSSSSSSSTAPPSKRQCRSLSCSDEPGGCRSAWRPQGSRVWTAVEKRRCHSGGSVQRGGAGAGGGGGGGGAAQAGFPAMQRSSSFSLPARSNTLELPCFAQRLPAYLPSAFTGLLTAAAPSSSSDASLPSDAAPPPPQPLYLSHEQICLLEPPSSPDSTPELERRGGGGGGLSRSRSQPCVLNDKKIGMKRRRPADTHKQRPSLDLAKMTQKLRNFHSLSCPGITGEDGCQSGQALGSAAQCETDFSSVSERGSEDAVVVAAPPPGTKEGGGGGGGVTRSAGTDLAIEELDWNAPGTTNGKDREPLWAGLCSTRKDIYQLGGELDIDQIERN